MGAVSQLRERMGYEPAPEKKSPLNMRVPNSVLGMLDDVRRIWVIQAKKRGDDPTNIDRTHVAVAKLREAIAAELDLYGGRPKDEEAWKALEQAIEAGVQKLATVTKLKK